MDQFIDHVWELVVEDQQLEELEEEKELLGGLGQRKCWGYLKNMRKFSATTKCKCSSTQLGCCCQKMARDGKEMARDDQ